LDFSDRLSQLFLGAMARHVRFLLVLFLLLGGPAFAAPSATSSPRIAVNAAPMVFYVVKGAAEACGRDCDSWIAAEGQIDAGAADRFRKFLRKLGDRRLPIYFYSPGGNLEQALAMGAMLRERSAVARVGRAVVTECGFEAQDSDVCLSLKQSGRELHGDLWTRGAMCNSACPYLILGAATREIAPDAALAVHSPRVVVRFRGGVPTQEMRATAVARGLERADRLILAYIKKMGADPTLLALARTIKFEDMHILTREEIARFGIDRRQLAETPWKFENGARSVVSKVALQIDEGETSYRPSQWRLFCFSAEQFELDFQRKAMDALLSAVATVSISDAGAKPQFFTVGRSKLAGYEIWGLRMSRGSIQSLASISRFEFTETSQTTDGHRLAHAMTFSNEGLAGALDSLIATCAPPPKSSPTSVVTPVAARDSATK
jgi:hypothetical protein